MTKRKQTHKLDKNRGQAFPKNWTAKNIVDFVENEHKRIQCEVHDIAEKLKDDTLTKDARKKFMWALYHYKIYLDQFNIMKEPKKKKKITNLVEKRDMEVKEKNDRKNKKRREKYRRDKEAQKR